RRRRSRPRIRLGNGRAAASRAEPSARRSPSRPAGEGAGARATARVIMADEPPSGADLERPLLYRRCEDVRETPMLDRQSSEIRYFLRTPEGDVFIVNEQDHFVWGLLD